MKWFAANPRRRLAVFAGLLLAAFGCRGSAEQPSKNTKDAQTPHTARAQVERGPVRVTVEFEPNPSRLSDEPTLTLTIDAQRGVKVEPPPFGEAVGDFIIRGFKQPLPKSHDDREILRQIYTLEPTRTGPQQIQPIAVSFTDNRKSGDGKQHQLETEPLSIEVASVVETEIPSLNDLRPAEGPIELPRANSGRRWILLAGGMAVIAAAVVGWKWIARRRVTQEVPLSPKEIAYLELQELLDSGLSERDVKEFYVSLTGIVRCFIEGTTGVRAPEQTTEEFLRDISSNRVFSREEQNRLQEFLETGDLVKFAKHRPLPAHVEDSFQRAKAFLGLEGGA